MNTLQKYDITEDAIKVVHDICGPRGYEEMITLACDTKRDAEGQNLSPIEVVDIFNAYHKYLNEHEGGEYQLVTLENENPEMRSRVIVALRNRLDRYWLEKMVPRTAQKYGITMELVQDCKAIVTNCPYNLVMNIIADEGYKPSFIECVELYKYVYPHTEIPFEILYEKYNAHYTPK